MDPYHITREFVYTFSYYVVTYIQKSKHKNERKTLSLFARFFCKELTRHLTYIDTACQRLCNLSSAPQKLNALSLKPSSKVYTSNNSPDLSRVYFPAFLR